MTVFGVPEKKTRPVQAVTVQNPYIDYTWIYLFIPGTKQAMKPNP